MFSALSSYIWGENMENQEPLDLEACDGEADWIFVEKKQHGSKTNPTNNRKKNKRGAGTVEFNLDDAELIGLAAMEESWYVTPPPCFTVKKRDGAFSGDLHASQFENLLIEHPSMSVYGPMSADAEQVDDDVTIVLDDGDRDGVVAKHPRGNKKMSAACAAKLQLYGMRKPLQELKEPSKIATEGMNRKVSKRVNLVHNRSNTQHKRTSRAEGRRAVQMGKRGS